MSSARLSSRRERPIQATIDRMASKVQLGAANAPMEAWSVKVVPGGGRSSSSTTREVTAGLRSEQTAVYGNHERGEEPRRVPLMGFEATDIPGRRRRGSSAPSRGLTTDPIGWRHAAAAEPEPRRRCREPAGAMPFAGVSPRQQAWDDFGGQSDLATLVGHGVEGNSVSSRGASPRAHAGFDKPVSDAYQAENDRKHLMLTERGGWRQANPSMQSQGMLATLAGEPLQPPSSRRRQAACNDETHAAGKTIKHEGILAKLWQSESSEPAGAPLGRNNRGSWSQPQISTKTACASGAGLEFTGSWHVVSDSPGSAAPTKQAAVPTIQRRQGSVPRLDLSSQIAKNVQTPSGGGLFSNMGSTVTARQLRHALAR